MSTKTSSDLNLSAGGVRSEPGGRARRRAGGEALELAEAIRDRLSDEVVDELLAGASTEEEIVGPRGVLAQLTNRLVERAMSAELTEHLGCEPYERRDAFCARNGRCRGRALVAAPRLIARCAACTEHGARVGRSCF